MDVAADITHFTCPQCSAQVEPAGESEQSCASCGWKGAVMLFRPVVLTANPAQAALPDDAACAHHPAKRAVDVCAGTGDYICSLCAIEVEGQTYSAQYLETGGRETIAKAFDRYMPRPDSTVALFMLLCFIPIVNGYWMLGMPIWLVLGFKKLFEAGGLRQRDPLFARLVSRASLITLGVLLSLFAIGAVLMILAIVAIITAELAAWR